MHGCQANENEGVGDSFCAIEITSDCADNDNGKEGNEGDALNGLEFHGYTAIIKMAASAIDTQ